MHAAVLLPSGKVLIAGGASDSAGKSLLTSAEIYDPASHTFSAAGDMNEPRIKFPDMASLLDGRVLMVGGAASAEIYDPKSGFRAVVGSLDTARFYSAAIQLMDGSTRIFGGYDSAGASTPKTWIYRP
jgi:Kelch motif